MAFTGQAIADTPCGAHDTYAISGSPASCTYSGGGVQPPTAHIVVPAQNGLVFALNSSFLTVFSCTEGIGGPGIATCTDSNGGSGTTGKLDTSTPGPHSYTVTATSADGLTGTATIDYLVA